MIHILGVNKKKQVLIIIEEKEYVKFSYSVFFICRSLVRPCNSTFLYSCLSDTEPSVPPIEILVTFIGSSGRILKGLRPIRNST